MGLGGERPRMQRLELPMMTIEQTAAGIQNLARFCEGLAERAAHTVLCSEDHPEGIKASGEFDAYQHLSKVLWDFAEEVLYGDGEDILDDGADGVVLE